MSNYYNHGHLTRDVSSNGVTLRKGCWAVVSVEVDDDRTLWVSVNSGVKNIALPFYGTDYENLVQHADLASSCRAYN